MPFPMALGPIEWILVWLASVVLNAIPVFMPPTWAVLAWAHLQEGAGVLPLALVGAFGATTGRALLALGGRLLGASIIPGRWRTNIETLAKALRSRKSWGLSTLALMGAGAVPSNQLFLAAGIARAPLGALLLVFGVSRFIGYVFWVIVADTAVSSIGEALRPRIGSGAAVAAQLIAFILLIVVMQLDWGKILRRFSPSRSDAEDNEPPEG